MGRLETIAEVDMLHDAEREIVRGHVRRGNFEAAGREFDEILDWSDHPPAEPGAHVGWLALRAATLRDRSVMGLKRHLYDGTLDEAAHDTLSDELMYSSHITRPYVEHIEDNIPQLTDGQRHRLSTVHGQTLSGMGRLVGATQVVMATFLSPRRPKEKIYVSSSRGNSCWPTGTLRLATA